MRILVVGDPHFRYELPYASAVQDGRRAEWEDVKKAIVETAKEVDVVALMGDNFNARHNHSTVINEFVQFLKALGDKPIHILAGNHERYGTHTALDFLQKLETPNWHVYTTLTNGVQLAPGLSATFIPYLTPALLGVTTKEEGEYVVHDSLTPATLAFAHHGIMGAKATQFFGGEIVLNKDQMASFYDMAFAGHLHQPERLAENIQMTGSIFTNEVGEPGKSVFVWDSENNSTEEILLPLRGIYKVEFGATDEGLFDVSAIPANSIVKAVVTDRSVVIEEVEKVLERFDASILVEQYPNERTKVHFEDGGLDLSVDSLLKLYSETKGLSYDDLKQGFELIK